jgi:hypothetical protein
LLAAGKNLALILGILLTRRCELLILGQSKKIIRANPSKDGSAAD